MVGARGSIGVGGAAARALVCLLVWALASPPPGAAQAERFDVVLEDAGPNRIQVISEVRRLTSLGLSESLDLVDGVPSVVLASIERSRALDARDRLSALGASVTIRPTTGGPVAPEAGDPPFLMPIEDVFVMSGQGTVATGRVKRGRVAVADRVEVVGDLGSRSTLVTSIEGDGEKVASAGPGDNVGLLLRGVTRDELGRGMAVAEPGSIRARKAFRARFEALDSALAVLEGGDGRSGRLQVFFHTTSEAARWFLPDDTEEVPLGVPFDLYIDLSRAWALEEGTEVVLRRAGRTLTRGVVEEVFF